MACSFCNQTEVNEEGVLPMPELLERASAYLEALEADRQSALALSEQKAEEAKLIRARQEGFRAAIEILGREIPDGKIRSSADAKEPRHRASRRKIPEMITRELSFSGEAMTARQIARAINYTLERTETSLKRMEKKGQVLRDGGDRWAIGTTGLTQMNGHAAGIANSTSPVPRNP
jgi:hypothetical protein